MGIGAGLGEMGGASGGGKAASNVGSSAGPSKMQKWGEGLGAVGKAMASSDEPTQSTPSQVANPGADASAMATIAAMQMKMLKGVDGGFYGHMTVAKCRKDVNIIGRGD